MNILSINIRGIGGEGKAEWIRGIIQKEGISFLIVQETQTNGILEGVVSNFWGKPNLGWAVVDPSGRSGGLLSMWDTGVFSKVASWWDRNFLVIKGKIKGYDKWVFVVNTYAPQGISEKRELWNKIIEMKNRENGMWLIAGDFNAVRSQEERKGSKFNGVCARSFNEFIDEAELVEYPMKGSRFTYLMEGERGKKLSKIDRFLVGLEVLDEWPDADCRVLPRKLSDHNPVLLSMKECNFGPKPFRFYNSWLDRDGVEEVVNEAADSSSPVGPPDWKFMMKLKAIRRKLKIWRDKVKSKEGEDEANCIQELEELDALMENRELNEEEEWTRTECKLRIVEIERHKEKDIRQRSRCKWAMEGDDNTSFFHRIIKGRKASNGIQGLMVIDKWETRPKMIKKEVFKFFKEKFKEDWVNRPVLEGFTGTRLSDQAAAGLIERFSVEEIK